MQATSRARDKYFIKSPTLQLVLLATLWLIAVSTGTFGTGDTELRLRMAHAWWSGAPEVSRNLERPTSREDIENGVVGAQGRRYVFYDPGQPVLMLPADWLASRLGNLWHVGDDKLFRTCFVDWLIFLPLNLALVLGCFWLLRTFGFEEKLAALTSLIWLIGTTVLPYAQTAFQNNQVLLFIVAAHAAILAWAKNGHRRFIVLSGMAAGAALLVRTSAAIHVFTTGLFLLACLVVTKRDLLEFVKTTSCWLAGLLPLALADRIFDYARYGSLFTTGQATWIKGIGTDPVFTGLPQFPAGFPFTHAAHVGILGALFSPAKSLFIYDPLLIPCLIVAVIFWRQFGPYIRCYIVLAIVNITLHFALTSRLDFWHGDAAWAARYHVTSIHLLLIPLLPYLIGSARAVRPAVAWFSRAAILLGISVQALAVSMPANTEILMEDIQDPDFCGKHTWNSPLEFRLGHRLENVYCLATQSDSSGCPAALLAQADSPRFTQCTADLEELRLKNRWAFFPFNPAVQRMTGAWGFLIWASALLAAVAGAGAWFYKFCRDPTLRARLRPRPSIP